MHGTSRLSRHPDAACHPVRRSRLVSCHLGARALRRCATCFAQCENSSVVFMFSFIAAPPQKAHPAQIFPDRINRKKSTRPAFRRVFSLWQFQ
jgi:hypothetical protein